ncbi:response regulator [bacterium]|nr:response regulator [bacterium]MBU1956852.1 response regulator [bacterium]
MTNKWQDKRLEIITLGIFILLVLTSLFFLYTSYTNYSLLSAHADSSKTLVHQIIMFISGSILFLSLFIVYMKRNYFFIEKQNDSLALENLFEEIKFSSDERKIEQFKQMLQEKNHTEIYSLISNMIIELQTSKKLTDQANETKTLFLSNMSHEIRTPITGILGFSNFLSSSKLDNEQKDFVNIIRKSSEDLLGLVNNILDISKIESGQLYLTKNSFNIVSEFENFIDMYALDALEKEIDFSIWIDPELGSFSIQSDAEKIKQILTNLLSNAIKFTNNGGEIELSIKKNQVNDENISVKFMVKDTGIGIEDEQKQQVFTLFNQADNSDTRAYRGVGLGLTIANNLVKMLGGNLELESELNKGTTFSFILNMQQKFDPKKSVLKPMSVALYTQKELQKKTSNQHLLAYLSSFEEVSLTYFKTFVECKDASLNSFETLYVHYDEINVEELKRIVAQYSSEKQIVLLTKLSNRDKILDIAPIFSQIIYEPITLPKVEKSLEIIVNNNKVAPLEIKENHFDLKALIVEDNHVNQKVIVHTLKTLGIESDTADNGEIGVEMFRKKIYDIVFMDIQMPVMNGVVATKHILEYEKQEHLDHTPIVAVTTNTLEGDRDLYLSSGMDEYIPKPIAMHKFLNVIKQFYAPKEKNSLDNSSQNRDILLYKKTPTEGKILMTMLNKVGYRVDLAKSREELYYKMNHDRYKLFLLDKKSANREDEILMNKISEDKIPTLFFMDKKNIVTADDLNTHTQVMHTTSDFSDLHEQVEKMMAL